ncbi:MAG TPA: APC family permease [Thermoanaerobaculaceae bacterium]|nr:APC family permease [Thermoanaerobaculaceae bacterium]
MSKAPEPPAGGSPAPDVPRTTGVVSGLRRFVVGRPRDLQDPDVFHKLSLMAFLAWVGLGADGLSSSSYGPDEAFRALAGHEYLALYLAIMIAVTVGIISYCYTLVVEHFPSGGGGYVVASKLLGPFAGVVSGSALVVDYVLTITVSVCSGVDAVLSFLPLSWQGYRVAFDLSILLVLLVLNLRGIKESIKVLLPIFLAFVITHLVLVGYGVLAHATRMPEVLRSTHSSLHADLSKMGMVAVLLLFLRAYSLGAGTYTGIEAVSNGVQILKEPRVATAKRTMFYMAASLIFTAGGIIFCYLLWNAAPAEGKTMNAVLLERVFGAWSAGGLPIGAWLVVFTLITEGALLFVAAQTGFIDGPRVLANMAMDSWLPHRFANLSERLVSQNGVVLLGLAAASLVLYTRGDVGFLVVLYSINVFLTFSLTQAGMWRFWFSHRKSDPRWLHYLSIHTVGLVLCLAILIVVTFEKFREGGWVTLAITSSFIVVCLLVKRHYLAVREEIAKLDTVFAELPAVEAPAPARPLDPRQPVAVLLVSGYSGLGVHSLLSVQRLFPNTFKNYLFISVGSVDSGAFKGKGELESLVSSTEANLRHYVDLARRLGFAADYRFHLGTDVVEEAEHLCTDVARQYPRAVFFLGKLIFAHERFSYRFLHNDTAYAVQRRLQFSGLQTVVMPIRMRI